MTSLLLFVAAGYYLYRFLKVPSAKISSGDKDGGCGGWNDDSGLPIIDMPPGSTLNDLLTDKLNNRDVPGQKTRILM